MKYQPFLIIFAFSLHRLPYLQVCHNTSSASFPPNRAYSVEGGCLFVSYTYTNFLIVTCYLLPQGQKCRCAFVLPSFCLRFMFAPIDGVSTDLQRTYNGGRTELVPEEITKAFFASLHRFSCILNKVNLPRINAYYYVIETISRLYLSLIYS